MTDKQFPRPGAVRAVNYIAGRSERGRPFHSYRIEQYHDGEWAEIPIYYERSNGELWEFVRSKVDHK